MTTWNDEFYYFDDDELAADWFNDLCRRLNWKFFEHQEEMLYMANETENGIPRFKEGAIEKMKQVFNAELSWMRWCVIEGFIKSYRRQNIDLSDEMIDFLIDEMGMEAYGEWEIEARNQIVDDYAKYLGREKALELAKEWWGENNGVR